MINFSDKVTFYTKSIIQKLFSGKEHLEEAILVVTDKSVYLFNKADTYMNHMEIRFIEEVSYHKKNGFMILRGTKQFTFEVFDEKVFVFLKELKRELFCNFSVTEINNSIFDMHMNDIKEELMENQGKDVIKTILKAKFAGDYFNFSLDLVNQSGKVNENIIGIITNYGIVCLKVNSKSVVAFITLNDVCLGKRRKKSELELLYNQLENYHTVMKFKDGEERDYWYKRLNDIIEKNKARADN